MGKRHRCKKHSQCQTCRDGATRDVVHSQLADVPSPSVVTVLLFASVNPRVISILCIRGRRQLPMVLTALFYLTNARNCDRPGEWFLDSREGKVYYIPCAKICRLQMLKCPPWETLLHVEGTPTGLLQMSPFAASRSVIPPGCARR